MYYSQRFLVERLICFVIRLIRNYGGSARRYAPVLSLRHAAVSRSYRRYCSVVCGCWHCSFVTRWPDELYRFWTFSYVRWWDGGFSQRFLGLSPGWLLGSLMLHEISREKDLFRVSFGFRLVMIIPPLFHVRLSHPAECWDHREIWILGSVSDAACGLLHCKELGYIKTVHYLQLQDIWNHYSTVQLQYRK